MITRYEPNYDAMFSLLNHSNDSQLSLIKEGGLLDSDYLALLKITGRFTYNRIQNFKCDSRDQILIKNHRYEIGYEHYANIYYIKYYYLFMLDVDSLDNEVIHRIERFCQIYERYSFALYRTTKGYHLFCLSHLINHQTADNILLQDELHGDPWYTTFSYNYGYKVRISHKKDGIDRGIIGKFIRIIGTGRANAECRSLLDIHDKLIEYDLHHDSPIENLALNLKNDSVYH